MFRHSKLALATLIALNGSVVLAQQAPQQDTKPQQLERVEVTGSNIKRLNRETVAPVEVITREQIERTGQPTAAEVLRNLPANLGSFGESFSNSFAPGAAGISLRGLGQKTTLVLLNGRRIAGYGFAQNLQDTFVDLNSIPTAAIERIDILKDGASAIYGSDAIAGVVNIILRKDYKGLEIGVNVGSFDKKKDVRLTATAGYGDRATDGFNIQGTLDYFKRDLLLQSDTEYLKSRDFRNVQGGRNAQSLTGGGTWRQLTATGANSNNFRAISECGGTVMTGPQAVEAGLINLSAPPFQTAAALATNTAQAAATNTFCTYDFNKQFTALPGTERLTSMARATFDVSPSFTAYVEAGLGRTVTDQTFQSTFFAGTTGLQSTSAGLRPFTYNISFRPGQAGNPFASLVATDPTAASARYVGVLQDMGTRDTKITNDTLRILVGAQYTIGSWDLDSGLTVSRTDTNAINTNRLGIVGTSQAFGVTSAAQPPVPVAGSVVGSVVQYNADRPSLNSAAVRDLIRANFDRNSISDLQAIDTRASTTLGSMQGGDIGLGVGIEFRREKINDRPAEIASSGGVLGQGITATNGTRTNASIYSELSLPLIKDFEAQIALRVDRYSDYGTSTTPKVGAKYRLADGLLVRANYGKGFRAPTLPEISPSVATFFTSVIDPEDGVSRQVSGVFAGNASLKAETSDSATLGVVFEPVKDVEFSANWYRIDWRNVVASQPLQDIIDNSCPGADGPGTGGPGCPSTPSVVRDPSTNQVVTILSNYQNLAKRVTAGFDVEGTVRIPTDIGRFSISAFGTYISKFEEDGLSVVGANDGNAAIPRVRGNLSLNYDNGGVSVTTRVNYTHSFHQKALTASWFQVGDPRFQNGALPDRVGSNTTLDFFGRYTFNRSFSVSGSVLNVLNKKPPYDPSFTNMTDISLYDVRLRTYRVGLTYKL